MAPQNAGPERSAGSAHAGWGPGPGPHHPSSTHADTVGQPDLRRRPDSRRPPRGRRRRCPARCESACVKPVRPGPQRRWSL